MESYFSSLCPEVTEWGSVSQRQEVPKNASQIDADWLTDALQATYPGVEVATVALVQSSEATNLHVVVKVSYRRSHGAPESMFCKLLPLDDRRSAIAATSMGPNELRFYRDLAPYLPLRVPQFQAGMHDPSDDSFVLVLEDLNALGCEVSNGIRGVTADEAAGALADLAALHVRFENHERRNVEAGWVQELAVGSSYGSTMLQFGLENHRDRLSDDFAQISMVYINQRERLHELWTTGPKTVIHGDPHIGNIFFDSGRIGFLDWGIINVNTPMRDVSYFLNMAMDIQERRNNQEELLQHYLNVRRSIGGAEISFDDAWSAHRIHGAYCVVASCQVVTFPPDATQNRKIFAEAFLQRAEAAIEDLESLRAIERAM